MNNNPNLNLLPISLKVQNTANRFIESTIRLNDVVVNSRNIGINRNSDHHVEVPNIGISLSKFRLDEYPYRSTEYGSPYRGR